MTMAASSRLFLFLSPILLPLLITPVVNSQDPPLLSFCLNDTGCSFLNICKNDTGYYTTNSNYHTNLQTVLSSLTSNDSNKIADGFYSSSFGENPDKVYATGLCRRDIKLEECRSCLNNSKSLLTQRCPNEKEAMGWYRTCTIRFSNSQIFGNLEKFPNVCSRSPRNISSDVNSFNRELRALMETLQFRAVASGETSRNFAAGNITTKDYTEGIYALVQCSPELSDQDCIDCIVRGVKIINRYCYGTSNAFVGLPSCSVAYSLTRFYDPSHDALIQLPPPPPSPVLQGPPLSTINDRGKKKTIRTVTIAVVSPVVAFLVLFIFIRFYIRSRKVKENVENYYSILAFDFDKIRDATNDFSVANKLGQGGFGAVYRGRLSNGQEIAVKRLIRDPNSPRQGDLEFKNEVLLVAKLGHRNLVNLLGFCLKKNERILVYEFVPNTSLDRFIFDPVKREHLDWDSRYKIIIGIARGLLYLHEESNLKIIHRDLKASNILLDSEMNSKISDFGTARLFPIDQSLQNTKQIVGTYGYMAPEYVRRGEFSVKSDVFSFGVLVLEIVSGQKVKKFHQGENMENLLSYAWKIWNEGKAINLADPKMSGGSLHEIVRCIHIGLLCVQEKVVNRPTMASVVLMLSNSSLSFQTPSRPAYFMESKCVSEVTESNQSQIINSIKFSENNVSITELYPR